MNENDDAPVLAIAAADPRVMAAILALNNDHAAELSWLDAARLEHLMSQAFLAVSIGDARAFLLAFDHAAAYDSPNFLWFRSRSSAFVYVDRVAVAEAHRGQGYARRLYGALFEAARAAGHERVVCEVNLVPPNPASLAFHRSLGFEAVGEGAVGEKTVRYFERLLTTSHTS